MSRRDVTIETNLAAEVMTHRCEGRVLPSIGCIDLRGGSPSAIDIAAFEYGQAFLKVDTKIEARAVNNCD
jgi:hypothetical protein